MQNFTATFKTWLFIRFTWMMCALLGVLQVVYVLKKILEYFLNRTSSTFLVGTRLSAYRLKKKEN